MAFLGKLAFWKKKDDLADLGLGKEEFGGGADLGLDRDLGLGAPEAETPLGMGTRTDLGLPPLGTPQRQQFQQPGMPETSWRSQPTFQMAQPQQQQSQDIIISKNIEVLSSKIDALQATLDSISQRLVNLERAAYGSREEQYQYPRARW